MKLNKPYTAKEGKGKKTFAEMYESQSRRPAKPVPVFQGTIRYQEAEEEE
ncbi:MAG: hypothetical protein ABJ092_13330 [Gillisia sp.]